MITKGRKAMLKFITLIGLLFLSIVGHAQKPGFYINDASIINTHRYFYLNNCPIDVHELTNPFINKNETKNAPLDKYFILYNELSLKNLTIIDSDKESTCIIVDIYESNEFNKTMVYPINYKPRKLRSKHLILDMTSVGSGNLIYRAWIDLAKLKFSNTYNRNICALKALLKGFTIQPLINE